MCNHCPRNLGIKRYWYLPHWSTPQTTKQLERYSVIAAKTPTILNEHECGSCDGIHTLLPFYRFYAPVRLEGRMASHYSVCPDTNEIIYLRV
jgi:hypothetical protein